MLPKRERVNMQFKLQCGHKGYNFIGKLRTTPWYYYDTSLLGKRIQYHDKITCMAIVLC